MIMGRLIREGSKTVDIIEVVHRKADGTIVPRKNTLKTRFRNFTHDLLVALKIWHNTMSEYGFAAEAGLVGNTGSVVAMNSIGIGTGTSPSAVGDSQLQTPLVIANAVVSRVNTAYTNDTLQLIYTFSHANNPSLTGTAVAVTEVGVFNGTINGTSIILLHQVYSPSDVMNWDQGDTLQVTVKVQYKQG
jgi:hypothetical protein